MARKVRRLGEDEIRTPAQQLGARIYDQAQENWKAQMQRPRVTKDLSLRAKEKRDRKNEKRLKVEAALRYASEVTGEFGGGKPKR